MRVGGACVQASSPACTELEVVMMDWLAKMIQLPRQFMSGGKGGGVIHVRPSTTLSLTEVFYFKYPPVKVTVLCYQLQGVYPNGCFARYSVVVMKILVRKIFYWRAIFKFPTDII